MSNLINLLAFDQSTSYTGVFAGTFDLDNPLKAPKIIYWGTVGRKRKKSYDRDYLICKELDEFCYTLKDWWIRASVCEDGFTDPNKPKSGLQITQAKGWIDMLIASHFGMPVHHVFPNSWRTVWGKHGCKGTEQLKAYSIQLATANMKRNLGHGTPHLKPLNDHEADAYWICCWLFNEIVQGRIKI